MNPRLLPVLALALPVATTVGLFLRTHPAAPRSTPDAVAAAHAGVQTGPDGPSRAVTQAFEDQMRTLEDHVASAPRNVEVRLALARLLHDGHREAEAVEHYREVLELDPGDAQVHYDLATAYGALGEWQRAAGVLRARLARAPDDAVAMYDLGAVQANLGQPGEARRWFLQAAETADDPTLARTAEDALTRLEGLRLP